MKADVAARVFEPFFTTKGSEGSGLGLATADGIVHAHNGQITMETRPGAGTVFRVYFPVMAELEAARASAPARSVLLCDDDPLFRRTLQRQLEQLGFRVTEGGSAKQAEAALAGDGQFELLISDLRMASGDGLDLAERIRA